MRRAVTGTTGSLGCSRAPANTATNVEPGKQLRIDAEPRDRLEGHDAHARRHGNRAPALEGERPVLEGRRLVQPRVRTHAMTPATPRRPGGPR